MKTIQAALAVFVTVIVALGAAGLSPTPNLTVSPKVSPPPRNSSAPKSSAPPAEPLASPMEQPQAATSPVILSNNPPPKPVLYLMGMEVYTAGGKSWVRLRYDVANKDQYPADMFAAAPALPPCGLNPNSSRTWVDFFDSTGKRLYGFCALSKPADLGKIWIAYEEGTVPPSYVYIELNDRQTNTKYKSNLADTTL